MVNTPEELGAWLRLVLTPGVGTESARRLLAAFGEPEAIFAQTETALCQVSGFCGGRIPAHHRVARQNAIIAPGGSVFSVSQNTLQASAFLLLCRP